MKIINKLKTITAFQFVVVVFIITLTIVIVKFFGFQGNIWQYVTIEVTGKSWQNDYALNPTSSAPSWLTSQIKIGDNEYSPTGEKIAEIFDVKSYYLDQNTNQTTIIAKLKGTLNQRTQQFIYNSRPIQIGQAITLNLSNVEVPGQVLSISPVIINPVYITAQIDAYVFSLQPWQYNLLTPNFVVKELHKDSPILTITKSELSDSISTVFNLPQQKPTNRFFVNDFRVKDVNFSADIIAEQKNGQLFFANTQPLRIGDSIHFATNTLGIINAEIKDIKIVQ